jgi:hypothetical protein
MEKCGDRKSRATVPLMPMQVGNRVWRLSDTYAWQHLKDIRWGIAYRDSDTIGKLSKNAEAEF